MKFIFRSLSKHSFISVSDTNLFTTYILFITRHLTFTMRCHGNGKQQRGYGGSTGFFGGIPPKFDL